MGVLMILTNHIINTSYNLLLKKHNHEKVPWGTNQNGIFEFARKEILVLPTLAPSRGLKNCFFTMKFLARHHLYDNNMCAIFQGQKIHTKKDIRNLPTCVAVKKISLLPILTPSQGLKKKNFHEIFIMRLSLC